MKVKIVTDVYREGRLIDSEEDERDSFADAVSTLEIYANNLKTQGYTVSNRVAKMFATKDDITFVGRIFLKELYK